MTSTPPTYTLHHAGLDASGIPFDSMQTVTLSPEATAELVQLRRMRDELIDLARSAVSPEAQSFSAVQLLAMFDVESESTAPKPGPSRVPCIPHGVSRCPLCALGDRP